LKDYNAEGGQAARLARYKRNHAVLIQGMREIGFQSYLDASVQSCIITSFYYPKDARFVFTDFYHRLSDKGFIIYPGKVTKIDCFRIGNIGHLDENDIRNLLVAIRETVMEMGFEPGSAAGNKAA
jgi:2-aminoethylphosphonate-pyruvate transaminase